MRGKIDAVVVGGRADPEQDVEVRGLAGELDCGRGPVGHRLVFGEAAPGDRDRVGDRVDVRRGEEVVREPADAKRLGPGRIQFDREVVELAHEERVAPIEPRANRGAVGAVLDGVAGQEAVRHGVPDPVASRVDPRPCSKEVAGIRPRRAEHGTQLQRVVTSRDDAVLAPGLQRSTVGGRDSGVAVRVVGDPVAVRQAVLGERDGVVVDRRLVRGERVTEARGGLRASERFHGDRACGVDRRAGVDVGIDGGRDRRVGCRGAHFDEAPTIGAGNGVALGAHRLGVQRDAATDVLHRHIVVDDRLDHRRDGGRGLCALHGRKAAGAREGIRLGRVDRHRSDFEVAGPKDLRALVHIGGRTAGQRCGGGEGAVGESAAGTRRPRGSRAIDCRCGRRDISGRRDARARAEVHLRVAGRLCGRVRAGVAHDTDGDDIRVRIAGARS